MGTSQTPDVEAYFGIRAVAGMASLEPWIRIELQPAAQRWAMQSDKLAARPELAFGIADAYASFCERFEFTSPEKRGRVIRLAAIDTLIKAKNPQDALILLNRVPDADPSLRARCLEATGSLAQAAEIYLASSLPEDALRCFRNIPDFEKALEVARTIGETPAGESLLWLDQMRKLAEQRPANFNKVVLPAEKKLLENLLENALGATRRKPATKKAATKKAAAPRKKAPKDVYF
jgi:hypothetical protein